MNIDIVNKTIAKKLSMSEKEVGKVNKWYWQKVKNHLYSYDPRPVDLFAVAVLYSDPKGLKERIKYYIERIRRLKTTKKFNPQSPKYISYMENYKKYFRNFWQMRKENKFTN